MANAAKRDPELSILMAEDDPDDRLLLVDAVDEAALHLNIEFVGDGIELLDRLRRAGPGGVADRPALPNLILLDLNMPRMDGREALEKLKADPGYRKIPVIIFTTSQSPEDRGLVEALGAAGFMTKPSSFQDLVALVRRLPGYCSQSTDIKTGPGPIRRRDLTGPTKTAPKNVPMATATGPVNILIAEDDPDDRLLIKEAIEEAQIDHPVKFFSDGLDLLDYLHARGEYAGRRADILPVLLLLDLNMPRMDGREALKQIKQDPQLRRIPVVILTTSDSQEEIQRAYDLGANSFVVKPLSFDSLVEAMRSLSEYWLGTVALPEK